MNKPNITKFMKSAQTAITKHSPEILTGIGIAGMVTTTVLAVKATPKVLSIIEDMERIDSQTCEIVKPTKLECVKATWKCYIPAAVTGVASIACLVGASSVNARRNAALAAAYNLSTAALSEYKEKVIETIGEKKEKTVRDKVAGEQIKKNPVNNSSVFITEKGKTLCLEPISGRYFKSDINEIKKAQNTVNQTILTDPFNSGASLNDFYDELGHPHTDMGDTLGWNVESGLIDFYISAQMADEESEYEGTPCIVLDYTNPPTYDF